MGTEDGKQDDALRRAVCTNSQQFDFYRLLELLEAREGMPLGTSSSAKRERFRLQQEVSLNFAPSAVASTSYKSDADRISVVLRNLGLFGPNGPLPLVVTEEIARRVRSKRDQTLVSFVNLFQHRLFTLFYRAWAISQPCVDYSWGEEGKHQRHQGALVGAYDKTSSHRGRLKPKALLYHAGTFGGYTPNRSSLKAFLEDYFEVPVRIFEFVGNWLEMPEQEFACLGVRERTTTLGKNCVVGQRIWNAHLKFRVHIGPVGHADFLRFLPNNDCLHALKDSIRKYLGDHYDCELSMTLKNEEVPSLCLGKESFLGWNTWVGKRPSAKDANEFSINLNQYTLTSHAHN
ncbi:MAG: type VI secretion system baseplate subunit TssG [Opitutaceae bacterium]